MIVYAMQPIQGGPVKIGVTTNLRVRKKAHEWAYNREFVTLATWPGDERLEASIHARFAHLRLRGPDPHGRGYEQFRPTLELMDFLGHPERASDEPVEVMLDPHHDPVLSQRRRKRAMDANEWRAYLAAREE